MPKIKKPAHRSKKQTVSSPRYTHLFSRRTKILLFSGLGIIIFASFLELNRQIQLAYNVPDLPKTIMSRSATVTTPEPIAITIPKVRVALPVRQTIIKDNIWEIAETGVSHLKVSANPGETGPGIYYAHNTNNRFGPIRWLHNHDTVIVTTQDGKDHTYTIVDTVQTNPKELSVFFQRKTEAIYLFTCDGIADLNRYIVIAEPVASPSASL